VSLESERLKSPSDILIASLEVVDDMEYVVVLSKTKDNDFLIMTNSDPFSLLGMIETAKTITLRDACSVDE
jgi:hypothetical protein